MGQVRLIHTISLADMHFVNNNQRPFTTLLQGEILDLLSDHGPQSDEILVATSDDPADNARIKKKHVTFLDL
ncbi:hypothetical protein IID19_03640 [Patescibacteria group bacterium]|nr:hypothetical protein [Patescibacteria group bacterium]